MKESRLIKIAVLFIIMFAISAGILLYYGTQSFKQEIDSMQIKNIEISRIEDGVYVGEYFPTIYVGAKVEVAVEYGNITRITLIEHRYGRGKEAEAITDRVISAQSLEVDTVTGATVSSKVILKAIDNALSKTD